MVSETALQLQIVNIDKVLSLALEQGYRCSYPLDGEHMRLVNEQGDTLVIGFDDRAQLYGNLALAGHLLRAGAAQ